MFLNGVYTYSEWSLILFASVINVFWMGLFTRANQLESTTFLSMFMYLSLIYAISSDILIFKYGFYWQHGVGALIIFTVTFYLTYKKLKDK